jgi:hypothetical protein
MSLAQYLKRFSRLRTYKGRKPWSALTTYQAPPYKPFLLLKSVISSSIWDGWKAIPGIWKNN